MPGRRKQPPGDTGPPALALRSRGDRGRPEGGAPEDREQRGQQRETRQQHHADPDGERHAEVLVEAERREQKAQEGEDHRPAGSGDRLADARQSSSATASSGVLPSRSSSRTRNTRNRP